MKREIVRIEDIADLKLLREGWRNATNGEKYWRKSPATMRSISNAIF